MLYRKITEGCVVQVFNDAGECIGQRFYAGDVCDYETGDGDGINVDDMPLAGREYQPYDMVQPEVQLGEEGTTALNQALQLWLVPPE